MENQILTRLVKDTLAEFSSGEIIPTPHAFLAWLITLDKVKPGEYTATQVQAVLETMFLEGLIKQEEVKAEATDRVNTRYIVP